MTPAVQAEFNALIRRWPPPGGRVLELGATAETATGFRRALPGCDYVGLDLAPSPEAEQLGVLEGNANAMPQFDDRSFDAVITSSMLEHDRRFWLTLAEVRRVLAPNGRFYVGVPGFTDRVSRLSHYAFSIRNRMNRRGWTAAAKIADRVAATPTYPFHMGPDDFFRFSRNAVGDVLLEGFRTLEVQSILTPPRLQAVGELEIDAASSGSS